MISRKRFRCLPSRLGALCAAGMVMLPAPGSCAGIDASVVEAAAGGDADAQLRLGRAHLRGIDEDRKVEEGVNWIIVAARSGHVRARTALAELHTRGLVVPYQPETAYRLLLESAMENHLAAAYGIARCYRNGIGVARNPDKAETWSVRAAHVPPGNEASLDGDSLRTVGLCYRDGYGVPRSYPDAADWLQRASKAGDPHALFELGNFYAYGLGMPRDDRKAFALYTRSAHAGFVQACVAVSGRYRDGKGVAPDPAEAQRWAERAVCQLEEDAGMGDLEAATDLYLYLSRGVFTPDPERAQAWLMRAVAKDYPRALALYGEALATGNGIDEDLPLAVSMLQKAADAHESGAHYLLFQLYLQGKGVNPDPAQAMGHLRAAADSGNVSAMSRLADWYLAHPDFPDAANQATHWQGRALEDNLRLAERDQVQAQLALVTIHGRGHGVPKDETKALYWLRRAAEADYDEAQYMVANAYDQGLGVDRDPEQALHWYGEAAEQGYVPAMLSLASVYERGELGVQKDPGTAQEWLDRAFAVTEEAALAGDRDAAYMVASFYRRGLGRPVNPSQVLHWLHRAAELKDPQACLDLSKMYSIGRDVARNPDEAFRLIQLAADGGHPEGRYLLGRLYDEGDYVERDYEQAYTLYLLSAGQGYAPAQSLREEMEVTLPTRVVQRARAAAEARIRQDRMEAGDVTLLEGDTEADHKARL